MSLPTIWPFFDTIIDYPEFGLWLTCTAHGKMNTAKIPNQQNAKFGPYLHDRKKTCSLVLQDKVNMQIAPKGIANNRRPVETRKQWKRTAF